MARRAKTTTPSAGTGPDSAAPDLPAPARAAPLGLAERVAAADLLDRARGLLADGRAADAELVAARAVELAPGSDAARSVLAEAERVLGTALRVALLDRPCVPRPRVPAAEIAALRLTAAERYLLSRCDGVRDEKALAAFAPLRELDVLKAIQRFADAELVELG